MSSRLFGRITLIVALLLPTPFCFGEPVKVEKTEGKEIVLENEFLRVTINPQLGGSVTQLLDKRSGKDLAGNFIGERPPGGFGLLLDRFWSKASGQVRDLETSPYDVEVETRNGGNAVSVKLTRKVDHPRAKDMLIEKTVFIQSQVARLSVDYSISNIGAAPQINRFWSTNVLRPDGPRSEKLTYFSPGPDGVVEWRHNPSREKGDGVWVKPQRGWSAVIGESGAGAVAVADARYLETCYSYLPSGKTFGNYPTLEWVYQSFLYKPIDPPEGDVNRGSPFRTRVTILPVSGLKAVHGASQLMTGEIDVSTAGKGVVRMACAISAPAEVKLTHLLLPSPEPLNTMTQKGRVNQRGIKEFTFDAGRLGKGTHVFKAAIISPKAGNAYLERSLVVGEPSGDYTLSRLVPKEPEATPKVKTSIPTTVESSHVKWAKPFSGGRLRVLYVLPYQASREAVEVWQRVESEFECLQTVNCYSLEAINQKPLALHTKMLELLEQDWDVIVFGATYWRMWPGQVQDAIAKKAKAGTGVVYVWVFGNHFAKTFKGMKPTAEDAEFLRNAAPFTEVPGWPESDPAKLIDLRRYGMGRVCFLNYPVAPDPRKLRYKSEGGVTPRNPLTDATFPFWEYHHSLFAKALIWAAGRTPAAQIEKLTITREGKKAVLSGVAANRSGAALSASLPVWAHDQFGAPYNVAETTLEIPAAGGAPFSIEIPNLRMTGKTFATVWLKDKSGALDWRTVSHNEKSPVKMEADTELPAVAPTGRSVELSLHVEAARAINGNLKTEIVDAMGRLLAEQSTDFALPAGGRKRITALLTPKHSVIGRHVFRMTLTEAGVKLARLEKPFSVDTRRYDDYISILWGGGSGDYIGEVLRDRIAETDCFDAIVTNAGRTGGYDEDITVAEGLTRRGLGIYAINMHRFLCDEPGVVRKPCLTNPEDLARLAAEFREKSDWLSRFAPLAYLMGDEMALGPENQFTDYCQSPTCLTGFRAYLKKTYVDVRRLNESWRTDYRFFDEATPFTFKQAQTARNYAPWADHRAYMDTVYAGAFEFAKSVLARRDPRPVVGYSGGGTWNIAVNGYNRYLLYQVCKAVTDYGVDSPDLLRRFMKGDKIGSWWWGMYGGGPENRRRHTPWQLVFRGLNGSGFFAAYGCGRQVFQNYGLFGPGYVPIEGVMPDLRSDVGALRQGLGKLLLSSQRGNSGIAVHYSMPSVRAAYILGETPVNERLWNRGRWGMETLLRDLGYQLDIVAPEQIEAGALKDFRMLILPLSQAMSRKEANAIREFVKGGGVVFADPLAARFDEHLTPTAPMLADVFGAAAEKPGESRARMVAAKGSPVSAEYLDLPLLCSSVKVSDAQLVAVDERSKTPMILLNKFGAGGALTFNLTFSTYPDQRSTEKGDRTREWMAGIMKALHMSPEVEVRKRGELVRGLETTVFTSGDARFVGLLQDFGVKPRPGYESTVKLPAAGHVYDARAKNYLGRASEVTIDIHPYIAQLMAVLPEKVETMSVSARDARPGDEVRVDIRCGAASGYGRVVRIEVTAPGGRRRREYDRNVFSMAPGASCVIPLALNDPTGTWKVMAKDVVTGLAAQAEFEVR